MVWVVAWQGQKLQACGWAARGPTVAPCLLHCWRLTRKQRMVEMLGMLGVICVVRCRRRSTSSNIVQQQQHSGSRRRTRSSSYRSGQFRKRSWCTRSSAGGLRCTARTPICFYPSCRLCEW
jgi:hypothetical protein